MRFRLDLYFLGRDGSVLLVRRAVPPRKVAFHYREWLKLLHRHGYRVAGKRPEAVFLNQVTRSPVVHATTQSGYYGIDLEAVGKLQRSVAQLVSELAQLSEQPLTGLDFEKRRERQRELSREIAKAERMLGEAAEALSSLGDQAPAIRAA